jgi:hypothetical protein
MKPFELSEITSALVRFLAEHPKGTRLDYADLTAIAGIQITPHNGRLTYARRILERDKAQVWACVAPGIGVYRLTDLEIAERQRRWYLAGARNKLNAGARQARVVELDQLDLNQQARFATDGIIREIASDALARATQRRIEKVARGSSNDLPAFNAIEWMISLSPPTRQAK